MKLVDTSIWTDHLRRRNENLVELLTEGRVLMHPFVLGELSCGSIARRSEVIALLEALPSAKIATHDEVVGLVTEKRLFGQGIGWMDAHLLGSALLSGAEIWTLDKSLDRMARRLGLSAS